MVDASAPGHIADKVPDLVAKAFNTYLNTTFNATLNQCRPNFRLVSLVSTVCHPALNCFIPAFGWIALFLQQLHLLRYFKLTLKAAPSPPRKKNYISNPQKGQQVPIKHL